MCYSNGSLKSISVPYLKEKAQITTDISMLIKYGPVLLENDWKNWKSYGIKWAQWAANGPVWMPQALKTPCLIQIWSWMNPYCLLLSLRGNKNWPPSMKMKKMKILRNKMGSMGCKWSSLNSPGTENTLSHSILKLYESPFPIISSLG